MSYSTFFNPKTSFNKLKTILSYFNILKCYFNQLKQ